jgi:Domain of unknown function (DUF222)
MESNRGSDNLPEGPQALAADIHALAAQDRDRLADATRAQRILALRRLVDQLEGQWRQELADLDARGAAGAEQGVQAASAVRTARALFRGPLTATAQALCAGELSPAHAAVLAAGTSELPDHTAAKTEPVLVAAARRLDPPRLRQAIAYLREATDPEAADAQAQRRQGAAGPVGGPHPRGHGRPARTAGARGRPDPAGGLGAAGPPAQRR